MQRIYAKLSADDLAVAGINKNDDERTNSDLAQKLQRLDIIMPLPADGDSETATLSGTLFQVDKRRGQTTDIHPFDVRQGAINNCQSLSPLLSMAAANPDAIRKVIEPCDEPGIYVVHATGVIGGAVVDVEIDATIYTERSAQARYDYRKDDDGAYVVEDGNYVKDFELWVVLLEKAMKVLDNAEDRLFSGSIDRLGDRAGLIFGRGQTVRTDDMDDEEFLGFCHANLARGQAMALGSSDKHPYEAYDWSGPNKVLKHTGSRKNAESILFKTHQYAIIAASPAEATISVANPHGDNHFLNEEVALVRQLFDSRIQVYDGNITIDAIAANPHVDTAVWYFQRGFFPAAEFDDAKVAEILAEAMADQRAKPGVGVEVLREASGATDGYKIVSFRDGVLTLTPTGFGPKGDLTGTIAELRSRLYKFRYMREE